MSFEKLDISRRQALYSCSELLKPRVLLDLFWEMKQKHYEETNENFVKIQLQYEPDKVNVTAACLRTMALPCLSSEDGR